jgi:hypothetical protein
MTRGMGGHSVSNVTHHLKGIHFPVAKQDLLRQARQNGAAQDIMDVLHAVPDQEYETAADVMKAVGQAEQRGDSAER